MDHMSDYLMQFHQSGISDVWRNTFFWMGTVYNITAFFFYGRRLLRDLRSRREGGPSRAVNDAITAWSMGLIMIVLGSVPLIYHAVIHLAG